MDVLKRFKVLLIGIIIFFLTLIPIFLNIDFKKISIYYGALFISILLSGTFWLIQFSVPDPTGNLQEQDYRFKHFTLRLALVLGIGSVLVILILIASQFKWKS